MLNQRVLPVDELPELLARRCYHPRMAVAGTGHADTGGKIQIGVVVSVVEIKRLRHEQP